MQQLSKEYLLLFNTLTDAENVLQELRLSLITAQRMAEELHINSDETLESTDNVESEIVLSSLI